MKTGSGSSSFHLPSSRQVEFPAGVSTTEYAAVWFFRRDRDCNPDSRALGTPGPRPGTVPRSFRRAGVEDAGDSRATEESVHGGAEVRTNAVNSPAFACVSPGHLVSRSYRPRHLYPSIADGSDLLSRSPTLSLGPSCRDRSC